MKKLFILIVLMLLFVSCASQQSLSKHFSEEVFEFLDIQYEKTPTRIDYPDAEAVFLLREGKYRVFRSFSTFSEHVAIKVMADAGKKYASVKIPFWSEWEMLDLRARTVRPDGNIVELSSHDFYEITDFPEYLLYADSKARIFTFPAVDTGCILEYIYTVGYRYPYVPTWYFQSYIPSCFSRFSYDVPTYLGFNYIISTLPGCHVEKELLDMRGRNSATFVARDLPAIKRESLSPPVSDISSWIMMSWSSLYHIFFGEIGTGQDSWYEIGKNYSLMIKEIIDGNDEIRKRTSELVATCQTEEDKIRTIVTYIQENFRYVAIAVEGHRIIPNAPNTVLKNQYGDCKDLSGLLITMLGSLDIDAYPVLISTKSAGRFIEEFPSLHQFNHVIVAIPLKYFSDEKAVEKATVFGDLDFSNKDDFVIIDPTASTLPLGQIHSGIDNRGAVLCKNESSRKIMIPGRHFTENTYNTTVILNFDPEDYKGMISMDIGGEYAARLRSMIDYAGESEFQEYITQSINKYPLKVLLDTFTVQQNEDLDRDVMLHLVFSRSSPLQKNKDQILVPVMFSTLPEFEDIYNCQKREHNIMFDYPYIRRDVFKIVIPPGYIVHSLPLKESAQTAWCEYTCSSYITGDTIIVNRNIAVKENIVPKDNFIEIRNLAAQILDSSQKIVIVSKK